MIMECRQKLQYYDRLSVKLIVGFVFYLSIVQLHIGAKNRNKK